MKPLDPTEAEVHWAKQTERPAEPPQRLYKPRSYREVDQTLRTLQDEVRALRDLVNQLYDCELKRRGIRK